MWCAGGGVRDEGEGVIDEEERVSDEEERGEGVWMRCDCEGGEV